MNVYQVYQCEFCGSFSDDHAGEVMLVHISSQCAVCTSCLRNAQQAFEKWNGNLGKSGHEDFGII